MIPASTGHPPKRSHVSVSSRTSAFCAALRAAGAGALRASTSLHVHNTPGTRRSCPAAEAATVCHGSSSTTSRTHQKNPQTTRDSPMSRPTSMILTITSSTAASTIDTTGPRNAVNATAIAAACRAAAGHDASSRFPYFAQTNTPIAQTIASSSNTTRHVRARRHASSASA